ncbi:recombination and DNA strand exchange inhibitor protein [Gloeomargarita lithophora Alchichica-D10]|uniref:Endonuclease MutS2 n=1 Tax=Gloeomargarita lithophora Alchichica-D10 TaxID=1188229 RepID=A0A1J0ADT7_9CYAN|nr:endonuclease MutS2 [Gloeomargarita lithophora]APB34100.1 recombination and DNA strand exchange inhibitor protein [Gloeomargarita lithophora Alchichica-D10]
MRKIRPETLELLEWPQLCEHLATFAQTKPGKRTAQTWQPATELTEAQQLLAETQAVDTLTERGIGLDLSQVADVEPTLERAERGGILSGLALLELAHLCHTARQIRRQITAHRDINVLHELVQHWSTQPELEQQIYHCIDDDGEVTDRASPALAQTRQQCRQTEQTLRQTLQHLCQRHSQALQEVLITQRNDRYVIPVKATHKDVIPGLVHDTSASGATYYLEPQSIVPLNNQWRILQKQAQELAEAVRQDLSLQVGAVAEPLRHLAEGLTRLDVACARCHYSLWLKGHPPQFQAPVQLRRVRHPLLVWQAQVEPERLVVPIDLAIPADIRVVAITGPNTGGKTVTLKTLGLIVLMAQAGLYIPAAAPAQLPWFDQVLADIGDDQSLSQNLSTFSGHITRINRMLQAATAQSLLLLDEVGAGTDPTEGTALAQAILETCADQAQLTLASSHYGELKALKYHDPRFENASVAFDEATLAPTYALLWGIPGRSQALHIAQRLGMTPAILQRATSYLQGQPLALNDLIRQMEQQRQEQTEKNLAATELLAQTEQLYQQIQRQAQELHRQKQALAQQQTQAVETAVAQAKQEIAQVIQTLKGSPLTAQQAHQASASLTTIQKQHQPRPLPRPQGFTPQVGQRVRVLGQVGEVLSLPDGEGKMSLRLGQLRVSASARDITSLDGQPVALPPPPLVQTPENTIDLRGLRVEQIAPHLDARLRGGEPAWWIVHGQGTGRLKQAVQDYLGQHPHIHRWECPEPSTTLAHWQG